MSRFFQRGALASVALLATFACTDTTTSPKAAPSGSVPFNSMGSMIVTLADSSLEVGDSTQATATRFVGASGTPPGTKVDWSSSDSSVATVSDAGVVVAIAPGSAAIVADSHLYTAQVLLTVTAAESQPETPVPQPDSTPGAPSDSASPSEPPPPPPPPPPPLPPADTSTAIPLGATIFADDFETTTLPGGWTDGYDASRHAITTSMAHSGSHSLRVTYPAGSDGGWLTHFFMPGYDAIYVRYYIQAPNWQAGSKMLRLTGSRTDDQWSAFGHAGECPTGTDRFSMGINGDFTNNLQNVVFYAYYPEMPRDGNGQCWGQEQGPNITYNPPAGKPGQWRKVEFYVKLNTVGLHDGVALAWVDGQQVGVWTNLSLRTSTILKLNALMMTFSQVPAASVTEQLYIDDVLIALPAL